ncbi:hypothetical protein BaRGS_00024911, partial [Batillaria attramentaria]
DTVLRCEAPAVLKGGQGTVTCYFNRDIGETREDFVIQKYDSKGKPEGMVLNCYWLEPHGLPSCDIMPGYDFDKQVTDKVTLVIREATEDAVGTYVCQVVPAEHDLRKAKCSFTLKESTSLSTSHPKDKTSTNRPEENKKSQFQGKMEMSRGIFSVLQSDIHLCILSFRDPSERFGTIRYQD